MTTLFSHSRLSSFENCRKKFHFRYVLHVPAETEGVEAYVGKRVHEILERLYEFVGQDQVPSLPQVLQRYYANFDEQYDESRIRIVKAGMSRDHYRELGGQCITNYYRRYYPFDDGETLGIEERVVFHLDEAGRYGIQGIIDRIVRTADGTIEIHDYKTGAYVPSQKKLDADRQLALYQIGLTERYGDEVPMRLVWHYVAKGQTRTSARNEEQLTALRIDTMKLIDRIGEESEFPAEKNNLCNWCEYKDVCPAWGHSLPAEAAGPDTAPDVAPDVAPAREPAPADGEPQQQLRLL
jgi:putative RecB family exonuclease